MPYKVDWAWPDFQPEEVLSPHGLSLLRTQSTLLYSPIMLTALQQFRRQLTLPILINHAGLTLRGYRSCSENLQASGKAQSMHLLGIAADCSVKGMFASELAAKARKSGLFSGIGLYKQAGFVHLDIRCTTDGRIVFWED